MSNDHPYTEYPQNSDHPASANPSGVEASRRTSSGPSKEVGVQARDAITASLGEGPSGSHLAPTRDHLPSGSRTGVPNPDLAEEALQAFAEGPVQAFSATERLAKAYLELALEASKLRFRANFGSDRCNHCEGLKAGTGVVATCFQVQQCNYTNVKGNQVSLVQARIINAVGKNTP